jgi:DNA polymerase-3 subunit delta
MPTPSDVRAAIKKGAVDPLYLILGDDEAEMARLAGDIAAVVEDELRAFNMERIYAGEKGASAAAIVEAARQLPMMGDRRVVIVLRAERLLKPKRKGKAAEEDVDDDPDAEPPSDLDALTDYVQKPGSSTTLVLVASDIDKSRKAGKAILKHATVVECWGLKPGKEARGGDLRQAARIAEQMVKKAVAEAGQLIEPPAARLVADRAGFDIVRLRGDLERLMLYTVGKPQITLADVQEVVSPESSQDDWAVTNAIERGNAREALRQLALALDAGAVSYQILGQLAWFVRDRMTDTRRIPKAIDALFRTDLALKSSGGDPRVLLERLVVELCGR